MTLEEFARAVHTYAQQFHASCTSWGRTPAHNKAVGGVAGSPHVAWLGADLIYDGPPPADAVVHPLAASLGLMVIRETTHDHIQVKDWVNT